MINNSKTNQLHNGTDGSLNVDPLFSEHRNETGGAADGWELNKGRIVMHKSFEILGAVGNHPI